MKYYTIYKITNLLNNKIYIGLHQTTNLDDGYMGSGTALKRAQKKYGIENFKKEILHVFDNYEDMKKKEIEIVNESFMSRNDTYNMAKGGGDGFSYINTHGLNLYGMNGKTKNVRDNFERGIETRNHKWATDTEWADQYSKKMSKNSSKSTRFSGKNHTDETKDKISKANHGSQKGDKNSQYGTKWIYSEEKKCSKKIRKNDDVPNGWKEGRKLKF